MNMIFYMEISSYKLNIIFYINISSHKCFIVHGDVKSKMLFQWRFQVENVIFYTEYYWDIVISSLKCFIIHGDIKSKFLFPT